MIVTYQVDGSDVKTQWNFDPRMIRASEASVLERKWGLGTYDDLVSAAGSGSASARRVLVWVLLNRSTPVRFDDFDPYYSEISIDLTLAEVERVREQLAAAPARTGEQREQRDEQLAKVDEMIEKLRAEEAEADLPTQAP